MKIRIFPEHNYKGIHVNGNTLRIALDPSKPIEELKYPEFYDVKITSNCQGNCSYCYQSSAKIQHDPNIVEKFISFFSPLTKNQKPFQIAFGGGEPTSHPDFAKVLQVSADLGITPNYTTNGMHMSDSILNITKSICGGVAVSTHPHLQSFWKNATKLFLDNDIFTNLHVIISDRKSIDDFKNIYNEYKERIKYFVLLPLSPQGRCKSANIDWNYLEKSIDGSPKDIAFGAKFFPYLVANPNRFRVSLYEPESLSKYLDLETMKVYPSSFHTDPI